MLQRCSEQIYHFETGEKEWRRQWTKISVWLDKLRSGSGRAEEQVVEMVIKNVPNSYLYLDHRVPKYASNITAFYYTEKSTGTHVNLCSYLSLEPVCLARKRISPWSYPTSPD